MTDVDLRALAAPPTVLALDVVHCVDLLTLCAALPDRSIDMIAADLPYGATACEWDEVIPFEPMWAAFKRVIKPRGAIVLTASQPFTSRLVCGNLEMFRCEWVWNKQFKTGHLDANRRPLKIHESILVFSLESSAYYPQLSPIKKRIIHAAADETTVYYGKRYDTCHETGFGYPSSIINFPAPRVLFGIGVRHHPNEKPVALFEYLIRTYTRPGEVVLDPVCGSGTTAIAARNCGRHWICGDKELKYVIIAKERLSKPYTLALPFDAPITPPTATQAQLL